MFQTKRIYSAVGGDYNVDSGIINSEKKMEKGLKIWQAVIGTIVLMISIGTIIVNLSNTVETQKLRIEFLENDSRDKGLMIKDLNQQLNQKYESMNNKLTDILVALQNKENKK
jgi:hypothetical protein